MQQTPGDRLFYYPTREVYAIRSEFDVDCESVYFESDGTHLHGWFCPARRAPKGTVVHCHGNAGNVTGHFQFVAWMPALGWNVLCFDYRGFGKSGGRPTRSRTIADAHAAINYAASRGDVDGSRLLLFGQSLGGAVAIVAAGQRSDLRGLAVEGAFSSYRREARFVCAGAWYLRGAANLISRLLISPGYDPIDHVADVAPAPVFFIAGTADTICDYRQTLELHRAAGEPKHLWVIEEGSHTAALTETDGEGRRRLEAFFSGCVGEAPAAQCS